MEIKMQQSDLDEKLLDAVYRSNEDKIENMVLSQPRALKLIT